MAERLPPGAYDSDSMRQLYLPNGLEPNGTFYADTNGRHHTKSNAIYDPPSASQTKYDTTTTNGTSALGQTPHIHRNDIPTADENNTYPQNQATATPSSGKDGPANLGVSNGNGEEVYKGNSSVKSVTASTDAKGPPEPIQSDENGAKSKSTPAMNGVYANQVEAEWIEQYEAGVYITLMALQDGSRDLKRVRFSRRRFAEHQAETWWSENRDKVYERYNVQGSDKSPTGSTPQSSQRLDGGVSPSPNP